MRLFRLCFMLLCLLTSIAAARVITVNDDSDLPDGNAGDGVVDTGGPNAYTGRITLRAALQNGTGSDVIKFSPGSHRIVPKSILPPLQCSIEGNGEVVLTGTALSSGDGLNCGGSGSAGVTIREMIIQAFPGAGILIAGYPAGRADNVTVDSCTIGTDANAMQALGNETGVLISGANNATVKNCIISGNGTGVTIVPNFANGDTSYGNKVLGCMIGLDGTGFNALPNEVGIEIGRSLGSQLPGFNVVDTQIGGTGPNEGNVVSGNLYDGIRVIGDQFGGPSNRIQGNIIGGDWRGENAIGNGGNGIYVSSHDNLLIGGTAAGTENIIVGNNKHGIVITSNDSNSSGNTIIQRNYIGINIADKPLGNLGDGIYIGERCLNSRVGGEGTILATLDEAANVIAFNGGNGISIVGTTSRQHRIRGNAIFDNGGIGIDLNGDGVSHPANTTYGAAANSNQPAPVFKSIVRNGSNTIVTAAINLNVNTTYTVDLFVNSSSDPGGYGEGELLLASRIVRYSERTSFVMTVPGTETNLSMTVTTDGGNSSEFSTNEIPYIVNSVDDEPDNNLGDGIATTGQFLQGGVLECTLRAAIMEANAYPGHQTVLFDIPGSAPHTINLASPLPQVTGLTGIDATSEPGYTAGNPRIEVNGAGLGISPFSTLKLAGGRSSVRGLAITNAPRHGIELASNENIVEACTVGFKPDGTAGFGANEHGIFINNCSDNRVGGGSAGLRNVVSGNSRFGTSSANVTLEGAGAFRNRVQGNYIGTDKNGNAGLSNPDGVRILGGAANNMIGGSFVAQGNVISGNSNGIHIYDPGTSGNQVIGNIIGLNPAATQKAGNTRSGILITGASGNYIGGPAISTGSAPGNVIAGNGRDGIEVNAKSTLIRGNVIGTNATGTLDLGNTRDGIRITDEFNAIGSDDAARNVISGNGGAGILLLGASAKFTGIYGNYMGLNPLGTAAVPNGGHGVELRTASFATIGGLGEKRNVISGNNGAGVHMETAADAGDANAQFNLVKNNYIGVTANGNVPLANQRGVELVNAPLNAIGGNLGDGNLISGNLNEGVLISGVGSVSNRVQNNTIGLNAAADATLPNGSHGIHLLNALNSTVGGGHDLGNRIGGNMGNGILIDGSGDAAQTNAAHEITNNIIGENALGGAAGNGAHGLLVHESNRNIIGPSNLFANNTLAGVAVTRGASRGIQNRITENRFSNNGGLGIDLANDGVTANDTGDADTGANGFQNYPVLQAYGGPLSSALVTFESTPNTDFQFELFSSVFADPSGHGEAEVFEQSFVIRTDSGGRYRRMLPIPLVNIGRQLAMTATNLATLETSEFSAGVTVLDPGLVDFGDAAFYPTRLEHDGARHRISDNLRLGETIDGEADVPIVILARSDDQIGMDDEDGVTFLDPVRLGAAQVRVRVKASEAGLLDAWIDFNRDFDFNDAGERIATARALVAGNNTFNITVPASTISGLTASRFRLSSTGNLPPDGGAFDGEVEDHEISVIGKNQLAIPWQCFE